MSADLFKILPLPQDTGRGGGPLIRGPLSPDGEQGLPSPLLKPVNEKESPAVKVKGKAINTSPVKTNAKTSKSKTQGTGTYTATPAKTKTSPSLMVTPVRTGTVTKINPLAVKPIPTAAVGSTSIFAKPGAGVVSRSTTDTAASTVNKAAPFVAKAKSTPKIEAYVKPRPNVTYISMPPHMLRVKSNGPVVRPVKNDGWVFYVLMVIMLALALIRLVHNKSINVLRKAFVSSSIGSQVVRDDNILYQQASAILSLLFFFSSALFAYQLSYRYNWSIPLPISGVGKYLVFTIAIAAIYSIKLLSFRTLGYLFKVEKIMNQYLFNVFLINNMLGLILIPFIIVSAFANPELAEISVYIALFIVLLSFLFRLFRGIQLGLSHPKFSLYYLFLYLCTLEIAPVLFVYKLLK